MTTIEMNSSTSSIHIADPFNRRNNSVILSLNDNNLAYCTSRNGSGKIDNDKIMTPLAALSTQTTQKMSQIDPSATENLQPNTKLFIPVSDSMLLQDLMSHLFSFDENPDHVQNINIVSTCSSLGSDYTSIVPQILSHYLYLAETDPAFSRMKNVTANVVHVIPQHKTIKSQVREQKDNFSKRHMGTSPSSPFSSLASSTMNSRTNFPMSPDTNSKSNSLHYFAFNPASSACNYRLSESNNYSGSQHHSTNAYFQDTTANYRDTPYSDYSFFADDVSSVKKQNMISDTLFNEDLTRVTFSSPFLSQSPPSPSFRPFVSLLQNQQSTSQIAPLPDHQKDIFQDKIFNTFAFMPDRTNALVVPPNSTQFNFALYPLLSHTLPSFNDIIQARFKETSPTGLMVVCYPTSHSLYKNNIMPCLDLALHQMLALNLISTQACEAITVPPKAPIYSFDEQLSLIAKLENAEVVYSRNIKNYSPSDWGIRWISEDMMWMRQTLQDLDVSSQSIIKLISMMAKNPLWDLAGCCEISLFIVKKLDAR